MKPHRKKVKQECVRLAYFYMSENGHTITHISKKTKQKRRKKSSKKQNTMRTLTYREKSAMLKRLFCILLFISSANTYGCCCFLFIYLNGALNVNVHRIHDEMNEQKEKTKQPTSALCQSNYKYSDWQIARKSKQIITMDCFFHFHAVRRLFVVCS